MGTLRDFIGAHHELEMALLNSGGEVTPEIEKLLEIREIQLPEKIDNYHYRMEFLEQRIEMIAAKVKSFQALKKTYENALARTSDGIKLAMKEIGKDELKGHETKFKLTNSKPTIEIKSHEHIPSECYVIETIKTLDKDKLREKLKETAIDGVELVESKSLRKYTTI